MGDIPKTSTSKLEQLGTTRVSETELVYNWLVVNTAFVSREKFEVNSPVFSSEDDTKWKLIMFTEHAYPKGLTVAVSLVKTVQDFKSHVVKYDIKVGDVFGKMIVSHSRENVFKNKFDSDVVHLVSRHTLLKFTKTLPKDTLLVQCTMKIMLGENPEEATPKSESIYPPISSDLKLNNLSNFSTLMNRKPCVSSEVREFKSMNILTDKLKPNIDGNYNVSVSSDLEKLSNDFESLYTSKKLSDVILCSGNIEIDAHSAILSARSTYFLSVLEENLVNKRIVLQGIDGKVLEAILYYLYTGKTRQLSPELAMDLLSASNNYQLPELEEVCVNFIKRNLCPENVLEVLQLAAELENVKDLKTVAMRYISSNASAVMATRAWSRTLGRNPRIAGEVLLTIDSSQKNGLRSINSDAVGKQNLF